MAKGKILQWQRLGKQQRRFHNPCPTLHPQQIKHGGFSPAAPSLPGGRCNPRGFPGRDFTPCQCTNPSVNLFQTGCLFERLELFPVFNKAFFQAQPVHPKGHRGPGTPVPPVPAAAEEEGEEAGEFQLRRSLLSSAAALSHVAGIQAGGALFPLEISDKKKKSNNPFPPLFSFSQTGYGCGAAGTQGAQGGGLWGAPRVPGSWTKGFLGLGSSLAPSPGSGVTPGLSGYDVQPLKGC